jgi:hypothetical protein
VFYYENAADSMVAHHDFILDFSHADLDSIHLSSIDANVDVDGDQPFSFVPARGFDGPGGELWVVREGVSNLYKVYGDIADRPGVITLEIWVYGDTPLTMDDFSL